MYRRVPFIALIALVFFVSIAFSYTVYDNLTQCNELASSGRYIDAGLCYEQFKVWDKCSYYLLLGARQAEKEWNFNKGPWDDRVVAMEYYGSPHTIGCLQNMGRYDLVQKVNQYHQWLEYWITSHANPPFDMDKLIASLNSTNSTVENTTINQRPTNTTITRIVTKVQEVPDLYSIIVVLLAIAILVVGILIYLAHARS